MCGGKKERKTMQEIMVTSPDVVYTAAIVRCDFTQTDACIDELEKRYKGLIVDAEDVSARKHAKDVCAELNKVKDALKKASTATKEDIIADVKLYEDELKQRIARLDEIRKPLWEQVKPQKKVKEEPQRAIVTVTKSYQFEGDASYISEMIGVAMFNGIKVKEIK